MTQKRKKTKKKNLLGEFLSEAAPSVRFLPSISKSLPPYPLETAPHSLNSASRRQGEGGGEERWTRGGGGGGGAGLNKKIQNLKSVVCFSFAMPFDHMFSCRTDG